MVLVPFAKIDEGGIITAMGRTDESWRGAEIVQSPVSTLKQEGASVTEGACDIATIGDVTVEVETLVTLEGAGLRVSGALGGKQTVPCTMGPKSGLGRYSTPRLMEPSGT